MAILIQAKIFDCFFVHYQPFFALVKTIMDRVRTDLAAMLAVAETQAIYILLEVWVIIILDYLE